jgi:hypothetical protein
MRTLLAHAAEPNLKAENGVTALIYVMPAGRIVQAQLSRRSTFVCMLGRAPHQSSLGLERN